MNSLNVRPEHHEAAMAFVDGEEYIGPRHRVTFDLVAKQGQWTLEVDGFPVATRDRIFLSLGTGPDAQRSGPALELVANMYGIDLWSDGHGVEASVELPNGLTLWSQTLKRSPQYVPVLAEYLQFKMIRRKGNEENLGLPRHASEVSLKATTPTGGEPPHYVKVTLGMFSRTGKHSFRAGFPFETHYYCPSGDEADTLQGAVMQAMWALLSDAENRRKLQHLRTAYGNVNTLVAWEKHDD